MSDSYVCSGATMKCTMGTSQATLTVLPSRTVFLCGQPMANISDHLTMVNLAPFGRCRSLGYPATAAATAAAHGKLTPMPCMHNTPIPWIGGKNDYIVKGNPALLKSSKCQCMWGGIISLITDGQAGEGTQWVGRAPRTIQSPKPFGVRNGTGAFPQDLQPESGLPTEKTTVVDFAQRVWDTVSPAMVNIKHKKEEFVDYVCDYVSDFVEQKAIAAETFIEQKQKALAKAINDANQFYGDAFRRIQEEIETFLNTDVIILWDTYWEKELEKDENQQCKLIRTKLRFIPQQLKVDLTLVFYFKYDDAEHVKDTAEFVLNIEIPRSLFKPMKYKITGAKIMKFPKESRDGRNYYVCKVENFSPDMANTDLSKNGFTEMP